MTTTFATDENSIYWWKRTHDVHTAVCGAVKAILENQRHRRSRNISLLGLYGRIDPLTASGGMAGFMNVFQMRHLPKINLNIINNMCQAVTSKITKNSPKPRFLTKGGTYANKKKAELLEKFCEGLFYITDAYEKGSKAFLDCTVLDIGALKVYEIDGVIKIERIYPNEILVDDGDAFYGTPSQLHQYKKVPRELLYAQYPGKTDMIAKAGDTIDPESKERQTLADIVAVVESWHLPMGPKNPGRHTICLDSGCLEDNEWTDDTFPFVFIRWSDRLMGFYGMPLAEHLQGIQLEIEKILTEIQISLHLCSKPYWLIESSSKINKNHINNDIGNIIEYSINPPQMLTPSPVSEQNFKHLDWLYQRAHEITGIGQLSSMAKKPPGLNSAVALQEFHDIESERFYLVGKAHEKMYMDLSKLLIQTAKRIYRREGKFEVRLASRKSMKTIDWGEVDLEDEAYLMQVYPTSLLPSTPSGKLEIVQNLLQTGLLEGREQALSLLEFPDTEKAFNYGSVDLDIIDKSIDTMLDPDKPEYVAPEVFMNLELAIKRAKVAYLHAKEEGAPELNLELLRRFMAEVMEMVNQSTPPDPVLQELPPENPPPDGLLPGGGTPV